MQINVKTNEDFKSCIDCIHSDDSVEICKLRECVHAVEVKECYEPKMKLNGTPLKTGHWIPVSERLPEDRREVLVTAYWHETYQVMMASYFGDGLWWCVPFNNCGEHMQRLKPKAWMPLPKPYGPQERSDKE